MTKKFGIYGQRVVTPQGVKEAVVLVDGGTISGVTSRAEAPAGIEIIDAGNCVVMPGLVDSHVHVNEPGRTHWEGFTTATTAAAAGGITTIADMPLNSDPVTTTLDAFRIKQESTAGKLFVDTAFFGGVVPGNVHELEPMVEAGVVGFKCFLIHSGIDDFPNVTEADLCKAMPVLAKHNVPLLVHAELEHGGGAQATSLHQGGAEPVPEWTDPKSYAQFLQSRPRKWEDDAIKLMIDLCRRIDCPVHIVHLSSSDCVKEIKEVAGTLPFTVETCPHYLTFAAEEIPDGDPRFKCCPPIRERENREKLWSALKDGTIKIVVSDHSPCSPDLKHLPEGDVKNAWGGVSSLQFRLTTVWTEAAKRGFDFPAIVEWLCVQPAQFLGLGDRKGKLVPGYDADIVLFEPDAKAVFKGDNIFHRHKVTPYEGRPMRGVVHATYLRGQKIYDGTSVSKQPLGAALLRKPATMVVS